MRKQPCTEKVIYAFLGCYFRGLLGTALYSSTVASGYSCRVVAFSLLFRLTRSSVVTDGRLFLEQRRAKVCDDV